MTTNPIQSLLIDNREPIFMQRLTFEGALTAVTQLTCGDVWIAAADGALLIVERKTADDLLASIADGRLFEQAGAMVAMSPWAYIAVEGTLAASANGKTLANGGPTGWQWSAVQGALQTVQEMGVAIIYLSGPEEVAPFLQRLAGRDRGSVRVGGVRKPELLAPGMVALMALPGIGPDRAKGLLEAAGSAGIALEFLTDLDWHTTAVAGIGDGTRNKVRDALGLPDGAKLSVIAA